ncbi:hypothetical protein [Aeromicrobium terrae]|uniref:Uncharacterized protein n=1 Tax=Aeromicrobium terrae TaxID=2498846 RepID=A0A5C8NDJ3_9ACTN|nr:hypothetical protein [Aeromicrobium terrae]TXL57572.1 hypothetical protein FHP06_12320 [Aeromicrobium terrae]
MECFYLLMHDSRPVGAAWVHPVTIKVANTWRERIAARSLGRWQDEQWIQADFVHGPSAADAEMHYDYEVSWADGSDFWFNQDGEEHEITDQNGTRTYTMRTVDRDSVRAWFPDQPA